MLVEAMETALLRAEDIAAGFPQRDVNPVWHGRSQADPCSVRKLSRLGIIVRREACLTTDPG
jgi:hypothetical protein